MNNPVKICIPFCSLWEGFSEDAYYDIAGFPTIGFGRLLSRDKTLDLSTIPKTTREAEAMFVEKHLTSILSQITPLIEVDLEDYQWACLLDFCYNVGVGAFRASTLRKVINRGGDDDEVQEQLLRWKFAGGKVVRGLIERRKAEILMWRGEWQDGME